MMTLLFLLKLLTFTAVATTACQPKEKIIYKYITVEKEPAPSETSTSKSDVVATGSLIIGAGGTALSLTDSDSYSLYCVTFEDSPSAFAIPTTRDGSSFTFNETLKDIAGRAFGCFLRKNDQTESTVEFSGGSTLLTGGGELVFKVNYDPTTKLSKATIDSSASTALFPEAVAAAKSDRSVVATSIGNLTGNYSITCEADTEKGLSCDKFGVVVPSSLYISQFEALDKNKLAIWESQAKRNLCVTQSATDAKPRFGFGLSGSSADFLIYDYRSNEHMNASMETVWAKISSDPAGSAGDRLEQALLNRTRQSESWRIQQCLSINDRFSDSNCRFVPTTYTTFTYYEPSKGQNVTQKNAMWFNRFCDVGETPSQHQCATYDFTGNISTKLTACKNYWTSDTPMCPAGTELDDSGTGQFEAYFGTVNGEDVPMRLVCKGASESWISYQDLAKANNKSDAINQAKLALGCDTISSGPFNGRREIEKRSIVNALAELSMFPTYNKVSGICRNRTLPAAFTFADCPADPPAPDWGAMWDMNNPKYNEDQSTKIFCYENHQRLTGLNVKIERNAGLDYGKLVQDSLQTDWINHWDAREFCPAAWESYEQSLKDTTATNAFNSTCMTAILGMSLRQQLDASMRTSIGVWNLIPYVACGDTSGATVTNFSDGFQASCLPQAQMSQMCDSTGTCTTTLRCDGTRNGRCYSDDVFVGRIAGRFSVMDIKPSVNKAFEVSSSVVDQYPYWNPTGKPAGATAAAAGTGAMELCTMVNATILNGTLESGGFGGYYKNRVKRSCEAMPAGAMMSMPATTAARTGSSDNSQQPQNIPEIDIMMKLKFTKQ